MREKGLKIILTEDGSHTIYSTFFDSTYHSINGAISESRHIFIREGLHYLCDHTTSKKINILEIGFGTGLNAFLSLLEIINTQYHIQYLSIESCPIGVNMAAKLNYPEQLKIKNKKDLFLLLHKMDCGKWKQLTQEFRFKWEKSKFEEYKYPREHFDLIYFDPFDPSIQSKLWQISFLENMYKSLKYDGIMVTYGAKGSFKRALKDLGMKIESLPGPPGKREITRAQKVLDIHN